MTRTWNTDIYDCLASQTATKSKKYIVKAQVPNSIMLPNGFKSTCNPNMDMTNTQACVNVPVRTGTDPETRCSGTTSQGFIFTPTNS